MYSQFNLASNPNQTQTFNIPGDSKNISLGISLSYNSMAKYWTMTLTNPKTQSPIVTNIPLLCGHDLLEQFQYLKIGSVILVNGGSINSSEPPNDTNLEQYYLIWKL